MELLYDLITLKAEVSVPCFLITSVDVIDREITSALKKTYEGHIYTSDGYVKPNSVNLIKRSTGFIANSDTSGTITFRVEFSCMVARPRIDMELICKVESVNQTGVLCKKVPYIVLIPRDETTVIRQDYLNIDKGQWIRVKVREFQLQTHRQYGQIFLVIAGYMETVNVEDYLNPLDVLLDINGLSDKTPLSLKKGPPTLLEGIDSRLAESRNRVGTMGRAYSKYIRFVANDFEMLKPDTQYNTMGVMSNDVIDRSHPKIWEILNKFNLINGNNPVNTIHVDVARAGTVQAVASYRSKRGIIPRDEHHYVINAQPERESKLPVNDEQKIRQYGVILSNELPQNLKADLIIANGDYKIENKDFEDLERIPGILRELKIALQRQKSQGSLILRITDIRFLVYEHLIRLLKIFYADIRMFKPQSSRMSNSERYLVCLNFSDDGRVTNRISQIDNLLTNLPVGEFIIGLCDDQSTEELNDIKDRYTLSQIGSLNNAFMLINQDSTYSEMFMKKRKEEQIGTAKDWCKTFNYSDYLDDVKLDIKDVQHLKPSQRID